MLTKKEHITFWKNTAAKDWKAVNDLFNSKVRACLNFMKLQVALTGLCEPCRSPRTGQWWWLCLQELQLSGSWIFSSMFEGLLTISLFVYLSISTNVLSVIRSERSIFILGS